MPPQYAYGVTPWSAVYPVGLLPPGLQQQQAAAAANQQAQQVSIVLQLIVIVELL